MAAIFILGVLFGVLIAYAIEFACEQQDYHKPTTRDDWRHNECPPDA